MDWGAESNARNEGPTSPKKKVHCKKKDTMESKVKNVRMDLKNMKDISARNLICQEESSTSSGSDESMEEVYVIEEETTEYVSENEVEIVEEEYEVYEEEVTDSEDSELEPLPPPIVIPEELRVKDSDDEADNGDDSSDDSSDSSEDTREATRQRRTQIAAAKIAAAPVVKEVTETPPTTIETQETGEVSPLRPTKYRGLSMNEQCPNKETSQPLPKMDALQEDSQSKDATPTTPKQSTNVVPTTPKEKPKIKVTLAPATPKTPKQSNKSPKSTPRTPKTPNASAAPKTPTFKPKTPTYSSSGNNDAATSNDDGIGWKKPDWTTNTKLRATGKSAAGNLAKPITLLPHLRNKTVGDDPDDSDKKMPSSMERSQTSTSHSETASAKESTDEPSASSPNKSYSSMSQTPTKTPKAKVSVVVNAPKSAPSKPAPSVATSDGLPSIEWEKPEWTKKKVLRNTSKGDVLKSGKYLSRPIGGIRPVD